MTDNSFFVTTDVIGRFGGDAHFASECADVLANELPGLLSAIRESMTAGAPDALMRSAHTLKGALSNFVTGGPTQTAAALEASGRDGRLSDAPEQLLQLERQLAILMAGLRDLASAAEES